MRIACLGNMNNLIAPTAQYLALMGHEVDLFLLYEFDHFKPEADYHNPNDIKFNIKRLEMDFGGVMNIPQSTLEIELTGYDFYIGTDYAPAILAKLGLRLDIFAWAGTDLFDWPFYNSANRIPHLWELPLIQTACLQYHGVRNCRIIAMSDNNDFIDGVLKKIGFEGDIIEPLPYMFYDNKIIDEGIDFPLKAELKLLKQEGYNLFVQHGRQHWKNAHLNTTKGNDRFLKGFAEFVKLRPNYKVKIVFFQYGEDVENTKQLARELGIGDYIIWVPLMQRKQLLSLLANADLGVGYWTHDTWLLYCTIVEFMFLNVPVIGYRDDSYYSHKGIELFPMLSARTTEEIAQKLIDFSDDVINKTEVTIEAKKWLFNFNLTRFKENIEIAMNKMHDRKISDLSARSLKTLSLKLGIFKYLNIIKIKTRIK